MDTIKKTLENKLDSMYLKIVNPYDQYKIKLIELQKEVEKTDDMLKLQLIMRQVEKIQTNIKDV